MNPSRIVGIVLLILGVGAMVVGMNASHSFADSMSNTFTGHYTNTTTWYIVGGIVAAVVGLVLVLFGVRGKHV